MIHRFRESRSRKRRGCSCCGETIRRGDSYIARNSSLPDKDGNLVYGFFTTHPECDWLAGELGAGIGRSEQGMDFPGWLPSVLSEMSLSELESVPGWGKVEEAIQKRFLALRRKKSVKAEPRLEYRYWDPYTKERTGFKSTLSGIREVVGNV